MLPSGKEITLAKTPEHEDWMSPLNKVIWMKAFRKREKEVTLRDGRRFEINYDVRPLVFPTTGETFPLVHVQPSDGKFAPCGYLRLDEVTDPSWVSKDDKALTVKEGDKKDESE